MSAYLRISQASYYHKALNVQFRFLFFTLKDRGKYSHRSQRVNGVEWGRSLCSMRETSQLGMSVCPHCALFGSSSMIYSFIAFIRIAAISLRIHNTQEKINEAELARGYCLPTVYYTVHPQPPLTFGRKSS